MKTKVKQITDDYIEFENGVRLYSSHEQDCCENHWLDFEHLDIREFDELEFDLSTDSFFERVDGFGIRLKPILGHPVSIPGYGSNNGYYSCELTMVLSDGKDFSKKFDITDCQDISE